MGEGPGWAPFKPSVDRACALQACRVFNATKGNVVADLGEERPLPPLVLQGPVLRCPWNTMFCPLSANSPLHPPLPPALLSSPHACPTGLGCSHPSPSSWTSDCTEASARDSKALPGDQGRAVRAP